MKRTFQVLAALLAVEVVIQAMAIGYGIAGIDKWVHDGHQLTKDVLDANNATYTGAAGFGIHGFNAMLIVLIALALLIVSFFAKVEGGQKRAGILFGMVILQFILGISSGGAPLLAPLHVLNGFGILAMAAMTARMVRTEPA